ncbi:Outer membrane protein beta-barrel domain-containing protein [Aquiflexum balticum DSM 16537]|uniref:Outer membrane protein beta-barrel domain-containing protein n=1 Tax=Aquiflexum balticum DSM 16537 TaxID=758820 RepID=A0A1W2H190_9BACT|nr:DUF6089 family protein [Aquiflexum balticum]SMD42673.1 Outer membrane protein beta-barrel domain-containing protein [Aquiflexum balticum DSM 16537]
MKKKKFRVSTLLFVLLLSLMINAQMAVAQKYEFGGGLGIATYSGDIIRRLDPGQIGIQGTLFGRRNFDNVWTFRGGVSFARLNAADSVRPIDPVAAFRDAGFNGSLFEISAVMEYHFLDYTHPQSQYRFSPYGFLGLGFAGFVGSGRKFDNDPNPDGYTVGTPVIPFGIGIKYKLSKKWILAAEFGARATFTDGLDKLYGEEPIISRFPDPNNSNTLSGYNYGNYSDKDWYYFLGITISYSFSSVKCYAY